MDESKLIQQSKSGDENAFAELLLLHKEKVFAHLLSMVHDENSVEDIMQEAMIAAYQHLTEFRQESSFGTWFWRIAHNKAISWLRRQKKGQMQELHEELCATPEKVEKNGDEELLPLLPEKQRECYRMYVIEECSQKEIAAHLQIPLGTVRSRIHYARKRLQAVLQSKEL